MREGLLYCWNNSRTSHSFTSECFENLMKCVPPPAMLSPPLLSSFHALMLLGQLYSLCSPTSTQQGRRNQDLLPGSGAAWVFPLPKSPSRPLTLPHRRELGAMITPKAWKEHLSPFAQWRSCLKENCIPCDVSLMCQHNTHNTQFLVKHPFGYDCEATCDMWLAFKSVDIE